MRQTRRVALMPDRERVGYHGQKLPERHVRDARGALDRYEPVVRRGDDARGVEAVRGVQPGRRRAGKYSRGGAGRGGRGGAVAVMGNAIIVRMRYRWLRESKGH